MNVSGFSVKSLQSPPLQPSIIEPEPQPKIALLRSSMAVVLSAIVWFATILVFTARDAGMGGLLFLVAYGGLFVPIVKCTYQAWIKKPLQESMVGKINCLLMVIAISALIGPIIRWILLN